MSFWGQPVSLSVSQTNPFDNDSSTVETIHQMIAIAKVSSQTPLIASIVDSCIRSLHNSNPQKRDLVRAIFWWIKSHVRFCEDEKTLGEQLGYSDVNQELLIPPVTLLNMPQPMGDCDDFSMLVASLMLAAKVPVWFVTVAVDPSEPFKWSHVYCMVNINEVMTPLDASHGKNVGWETQREVYRRQEWYVG